MDSKALLAIVLSFMLFMLWHFFFAPVQPPQPEKREAPQGSTVQPQATPAPVPQNLLPQTPTVRVDPSTLKTWTIGDSLYQMQIVEQGARASSFTLKNYRETVAPDSPPVQMISTRDTLHFPIAVDLIHRQDLQLSTRSYTSDAPLRVEVQGEAPSTVTYHTEIPGKVAVSKVFTATADSYALDMEVRLRNLSPEKLVDQVGISFYYKPYSDSNSSYNPSQLTFSNKGTLTPIAAKDLKPDSLPKPPYDWVAYENNYFLQAIIPITEEAYQIVPRVLDEASGLIQVVYLSNPVELGSEETKILKFRLYAGPKQIERLEQAGHNLADAVDYGWFSFLAKPLLVALKWLYSYTHNYGIAIILITIILKIIFWPLTQKSYTSMQRMKKVQPKIAQIREKYKNDREKLNQELMLVYKTHKVNPMGGCLPMVLQIPVFFALYRMLNAAVDLRHQPFMLWINDLTAPDRLDLGFSVDIPFLGNLNGIPVLTILMGITMFIQQKMTPSTGDPRQEKIMLIMPVMFTFFFINFPSGLVLYWFVNNILSIAQQYWINRSAA
ncbi:MAG: membrane protein insertase YidC [Syntrophobacteraceae bacterium]